MAGKRVTAGERRGLILDAARRVFAAQGYDGARTARIAREAGVSEPLIFRHFPTKLSLYRGVLRRVFREQDRNYARVGIGVDAPGTAGLVRSIHRYFDAIVHDPHASGQEFYRLTLASLAANGDFAALVYRRAQRRAFRQIAAAHAAARHAGDIAGEPLNIREVGLFTEHVGTMMSALRVLDPASRPYESDGDALVRQATWFCCRGFGLTDTAIARHLPAPGERGTVLTAP